MKGMNVGTGSKTPSHKKKVTWYLFLDEATSSLDSQTEQEIQKSISAMLEANNATVIAIAHRLSTIKHLDRIIVIEGGQVTEDGLFQELLAKENGKFKTMWNSQVNGMVV